MWVDIFSWCRCVQRICICICICISKIGRIVKSFFLRRAIWLMTDYWSHDRHDHAMLCRECSVSCLTTTYHQLLSSMNVFFPRMSEYWVYIFHATTTTENSSESNPKHCWSIDIVLFPWTVDLQTTATSTVDPVQTRRFASSASGPSEGQGRRSPLCRGGLIISKGSSTRGWVLPISEVISKLAFVSHTANNYRAMLIWSK